MWLERALGPFTERVPEKPNIHMIQNWIKTGEFSLVIIPHIEQILPYPGFI